MLLACARQCLRSVLQALAREKQLRADVSRAQRSADGAKEADTDAKQAEVEAEQRAVVAEELQENAELRADEAIQEAEAAAEAAADAAEEVSDAEYVAAVLKGKLRRAELKAEEHVKRAAKDRAELQRGPRDRTVDEWAALDKEAKYKAEQRERLYLTNFLQSHTWRMKDIAAAFDELGPPLPQPATHLCRP